MDAAPAAPIFQDLLVYIVAYKDVDASQTTALVHALQQHGAAVAARSSAKVTHVVVQRTHAPVPADRADGDARLREVYQKVVDAVSGWLAGAYHRSVALLNAARSGCCRSTRRQLGAAVAHPLTWDVLCAARHLFVCTPLQAKEPVAVVSAAWVHKSLEQGFRAPVSPAPCCAVLSRAGPGRAVRRAVCCMHACCGCMPLTSGRTSTQHEAARAALGRVVSNCVWRTHAAAGAAVQHNQALGGTPAAAATRPVAR
jgi:hypothetical protein